LSLLGQYGDAPPHMGHVYGESPIRRVLRANAARAFCELLLDALMIGTLPALSRWEKYETNLAV